MLKGSHQECHSKDLTMLKKNLRILGKEYQRISCIL